MKTLITNFFLIFSLLASQLVADDDWIQKFPSSSPAARNAHGMCFIGDDKIVMFGGQISSYPYYFDDTWIYDLSDNTWTNMNPSGDIPSLRAGCAMAYLGEDDDRVLLFGGFNDDNGLLNDTWVYDLSENAWTEMNPAGDIPSVRLGHAMVFIDLDQTLLFGGFNYFTNEYFNDTYIYDLSENTWYQQNPGTKPDGRYDHGMAYFGWDKVILFGGYAYNDEYGAEMESDSTWIYSINSATWTNMEPTGTIPTPRTEHAMAYVGGDRALMFGGFLSTFTMNDTWIYDFSDNTWIEDINTSEPVARRSHRIAETSFDGSSYLVIFGGGVTSGMSFYNDTWTFGGGDYSLPVELSSFSAFSGNKEVTLKWTTQSEIENLGFIIERSMHNQEEFTEIASYQNCPQLMGQGNSNQKSDYIYHDGNLFNGITYYYRLVDISLSGQRNVSKIISATPSENNNLIPLNTLPDQFNLFSNYPNPFNPSTTIKFEIPEIEDGTLLVNLSVFTISGKKVKTLYDGVLTSGSYKTQWNGNDQFGNKVSSGTYFYSLNSDQFNAVKKMILIQ